MANRNTARRHREDAAGGGAVWAVMREGPIAFAAGDALVRPGGTSGIVFRILSGWIALTRAAPVHGSEATVVGLALPGDLVSAEVLEAAEADAAVCLGPVSVMAASEAVLRGLAAANPTVDHWMASQGASRRSWAKFFAAEGGSGQERRRLAALLSWLLGRLEDHRGGPLDTILLPLSLEQVAGMVAASPEKFGDALEWLLGARVLRCAWPVAGSVVIGIADRSGLSAVGRWCMDDGKVGKQACNRRDQKFS